MSKYVIVIIFATFLSSCFSLDAKAYSNEEVYLKIEFSVKESRNADFMNIMKTLNRDMKSETGFVWARVFVRQGDRSKVTLIEKWDTRALHEKHYAEIVENGSWASILGMLTETPNMAYLTYYNSIPVDTVLID